MKINTVSRACCCPDGKASRKLSFKGGSASLAAETGKTITSFVTGAATGLVSKSPALGIEAASFTHNAVEPVLVQLNLRNALSKLYKFVSKTIS